MSEAPASASGPRLELLVLDADPQNREATELAQALGMGPRRPGSRVPVEALIQAGIVAKVELPAGNARTILLVPGLFADSESAELAATRAEVKLSFWAGGEPDPSDPLEARLQEHVGIGLPELMRMDAEELLPVDYALDAEPRARNAATPDPEGEAGVARQILLFLALAMAALAAYFGLMR